MNFISFAKLLTDRVSSGRNFSVIHTHIHPPQTRTHTHTHTYSSLVNVLEGYFEADVMNGNCKVPFHFVSLSVNQLTLVISFLGFLTF